MRRWWAAVLLVGVLLASACAPKSNDPLKDEATKLVGLDGVEAVSTRPSLDPPPEALVEEPPRNETDRLLRKSKRRTGLCLALAKVDSLEEPEPRRLDKLLGFAGNYQGVLNSFDPGAKVRDPDSVSGGEIEPPKDVVDAMAAMHVAMFAYRVRLTYAQQLIDAERVSKADIGPWIDHAWFELVNSPFSEAQQLLVRASKTYCE